MKKSPIKNYDRTPKLTKDPEKTPFGRKYGDPPEPGELSVDMCAPEAIIIRVEATTTPAAPKAWGTLKAQPYIFSTGGVGYNLSGRVTNPASGETYLFSGNLVLAGSTPKKAKLFPKDTRKKPDFKMGVIFTSFRRGDVEKVRRQVMKEYAVIADVVTHETGEFAVKCKAIGKK